MFDIGREELCERAEALDAGLLPPQVNNEHTSIRLCKTCCIVLSLVHNDQPWTR
jgi:hypothetical protein